MRNSFVNLAVPIMQLSEPGEAQKIKLTDDLTVTVWDRWEVTCSKGMTVQQLFEQLEERYRLKPRDIYLGLMPVYLSANMDLESKKTEKQALLNKPLNDLLQLDSDFVDLTITFTKL